MRIMFYDVETARVTNIGSICAIGWILLDNDHELSSGYSLINPHCTFDKKNISIHGITEKDVADSPCFAEYWNSTLRDIMGSSLVIAHNAGFDLSATEQAIYGAGLEDPGIDYIDSLPIIRHFIPDSNSYRLIDLAAYFSYEYRAHDALEDVKALHHVLCSIRDKFNYEDLSALLIRSGVISENTLTNRYLPHRIIDKNMFRSDSRCHDIVTQINDSLSGLRICITGDINGYEREDIERMIMERGGRMTSSVSGKTDYLVVGCYPDRDDGFISGKHRTAIELINQGAKVRIINPDDFFSMLK